MRAPRSRLAPRRGGILAIVAVSLIALISVLALCLDGGRLYDDRRKVQAAADMAALAAAEDLYARWLTNAGADPNGTAAAAAIANASANGYTTGGATTVTVRIPPTTGEFVGRVGYAEVVITFSETRLFSRIFAQSNVPVTARAVARGRWPTFNAGLLALHPTASQALAASGNGGITVNGGASIAVNSNHSTAAAYANGNGSVTAANINISGGYSTTGNATFNGSIQTNAQPTPDPLAYLPAPSMAGLPVRSSSLYQVSGSGSTTLQPGVYTGGIRISGNGNVTFSPGIYYINGGGVSMSGNANLSGNGVMFYNTGSGAMNLTGNGTLNVTPMTTGIYQGISIFQDRTSTAQVSLRGNGSTSQFLGTVYAANAPIVTSGNGNLRTAQLIGNTVNATGNGGVTVNWSAQTAHTRQLNLVE